MTTEDLMKLADAYAKVGDSADISLIKHHRSALKSALEALGRDVAELKPLAALGAEMHAMTTTVHTDSIPFNEQLQIVPSLWLECMKERDQARAELAAIRAQEPVAETTCDCYPDHGGTIYAEAVLPSGTPLYASPATKDAGLVAALKDAATSLETISRLAGRTHYVGDDGERVETYMGHHDQVRGYATSRASVARDALSKFGGV